MEPVVETTGYKYTIPSGLTCGHIAKPGYGYTCNLEFRACCGLFYTAYVDRLEAKSASGGYKIVISTPCLCRTA